MYLSLLPLDRHPDHHQTYIMPKTLKKNIQIPCMFTWVSSLYKNSKIHMLKHDVKLDETTIIY